MRPLPAAPGAGVTPPDTTCSPPSSASTLLPHGPPLSLLEGSALWGLPPRQLWGAGTVPPGLRLTLPRVGCDGGVVVAPLGQQPPPRDRVFISVRCCKLLGGG